MINQVSTVAIELKHGIERELTRIIDSEKDYEAQKDMLAKPQPKEAALERNKTKLFDSVG